MPQRPPPVPSPVPLPSSCARSCHERVSGHGHPVWASGPLACIVVCGPAGPCARSSMDRASDYGSEGWGFESLRAHVREAHRGHAVRLSRSRVCALPPRPPRRTLGREGARGRRGRRWRRAVRRRRLIVRTTVLVLALGAAVGLVAPDDAAAAFGIGPALLVMVLRAAGGGSRPATWSPRCGTGPRPDRPPSHTWWMCELPVDHPVRARSRRRPRSNPTWRCRRCGHGAAHPAAAVGRRLDLVRGDVMGRAARRPLTGRSAGEAVRPHRACEGRVEDDQVAELDPPARARRQSVLRREVVPRGAHRPSPHDDRGHEARRPDGREDPAGRRTVDRRRRPRTRRARRTTATPSVARAARPAGGVPRSRAEAGLPLGRESHGARDRGAVAASTRPTRAPAPVRRRSSGTPPAARHAAATRSRNRPSARPASRSRPRRRPAAA